MKMWPLLLDMSKVDCKRMLRRLGIKFIIIYAWKNKTFDCFRRTGSIRNYG